MLKTLPAAYRPPVADKLVIREIVIGGQNPGAVPHISIDYAFAAPDEDAPGGVRIVSSDRVTLTGAAYETLRAKHAKLFDALEADIFPAVENSLQAEYVRKAEERTARALAAQTAPAERVRR